MPQVTIVPTGESFCRRSRRARADGCAADGPQPAAQLQGRALCVLPCAAAVGRDDLSDARASCRDHPGRGGRTLRAVVPGPGHHGHHDRDARDAAGPGRRGEEPAEPDRSDGAPGRRRHGRVPQAAGRRGPALPRGAVHRFHPVGRAPPQLFAGERTGRRQDARGARASRIVERVHWPAVRHHACRQPVARRGPARAVLVPRRFAAACGDDRRRHGLRAVACYAAAVTGRR